MQLSMNLVDPDRVGPQVVADGAAARVDLAGAELVGLLPRRVLHAIEPGRWPELDLAEPQTIEARLAAAGLSAG